MHSTYASNLCIQLMHPTFTIHLVFWRPLPKRRRLFYISSTRKNTSALFHVFRFLLLHIFEYLGDLFIFAVQVLEFFLIT